MIKFATIIKPDVAIMIVLHGQTQEKRGPVINIGIPRYSYHLAKENLKFKETVQRSAYAYVKPSNACYS